MLNEELFKYITDLVTGRGTMKSTNASSSWEYMDIFYTMEWPDRYLDFNDLCIYAKKDGKLKATYGGLIDCSVSQVLSEIYNHIHKG